jgi:hypothetical protein
MSDTPDLHINALLIETGVNMGDHAQDVTKALVIDPDMTVRDLVTKHLLKEVWMGVKEPNRVEVNPDRVLTLRLAVDA